MSDFMKQLEKAVMETAPPEALISKVSLEASEVIIYTKNIALFLNSENIVKELASKLKKRIHIRCDSSMLESPDSAKQKITSLVPAEANIEDLSFDAEFNEVIIEAKKLGLVIGKHGQTLKEIAIKTGWMPKLLRVPTKPSPVMKGIRHTLLKENKERATMLKDIGKRIYREGAKPTEWVRLTPLGGSREVGRSCFLLETPESKVLLDCGLNIGYKDKPYPHLDSISFPLDELDAVIVSHAHLDHVGFVPYLYKYGYKGPTYCTPPTRDVSALLQLDYIDVMMKEGQTPPYQEKHVKDFARQCITLEYGDVTDIAPDMRLTLHNAGHVLGSSAIHLHIGQGVHNLLYTGDFKFGYTKLFDAIQTRYPRIETLIIESTYGGTNNVQPPRYAADKRLIEVIMKTTEKGGSVLIPAFAIGRAQEIMAVIEEYGKRNPWDIPVYVDGMTKEASAMHSAYPEYLRGSLQRRVLHNDSPFDSDMFLEVDNKQRQNIAEEKSSVIISPSGMMNGGPVVEYFKRMAENENNALIFVGWQGEGTLGRKLQAMETKVEGTTRQLPMHVEGKTVGIGVKLHIETIEGYSGHADFTQLLAFYKKVLPKPERVITVHGEENKCVNLARNMGYKFRVEAITPRNLDTIRLK